MWESVEARWPLLIKAGQVSFTRIREGMESFLVERGVLPQAFSHFGLVVHNIGTSLEALSEFCGVKLKRAKRIWVEAYGVYVARCILEGKELEFIEPVGKSLFYGFLKENGERLHHLGFLVKDIQNSLERLKANKVELIDQKPRSGSHGKIAFLSPGLFGWIYIELCQKQK